MTKQVKVYDRHGGAFRTAHWRTVFHERSRLRLEVTKVVAWDWSGVDLEERKRRGWESPDLITTYGKSWQFNFPPGTDLTVHKAYCRGEMPAAVYADWLEEQGVQMPPECYDLLRGWTGEDE